MYVQVILVGDFSAAAEMPPVLTVTLQPYQGTKVTGQPAKKPANQAFWPGQEHPFGYTPDRAG